MVVGVGSALGGVGVGEKWIGAGGISTGVRSGSELVGSTMGSGIGAGNWFWLEEQWRDDGVGGFVVAGDVGRGGRSGGCCRSFVGGGDCRKIEEEGTIVEMNLSPVICHQTNGTLF
ncbi:hypothetical protein K7X08_003007 [Anisodus acutangulus]|uniref:Uncharacterized protein n=1 Tax=Anisodus acutangulus TaxID=402998 RepID=A0A9Q1RHI7_9SOLA|nr:hypothetical protein K7X08_003007 [Anisodus acutangulus]